MIEVEWTREGGDYYARRKLKSGKTAMIGFSRETRSGGSVEYHVSFGIVGKRKSLGVSDYFDDRITGDGTLEGLVFAKTALMAFEECVTRDCVVVVSGSDSRRQRVYGRYLTRLGYTKERRDSQIVMTKRVCVT